MPTRRTSRAATTIRRAGRRGARRSARTGGGCARASATGPHPRQRLRSVPARRARPRGLVVFVHGGYWRAFDRELWSHLAGGPLARGWAVAIPGYVLAPEARIARDHRDDRARRSPRRRREVAGAAAAGRAFGGRASGGAAGLRDSGAAGGGGAGASSVCRPDQRAARPAAAAAHRTERDLRLDAAEAAAESPALLDAAAGHARACLGRRRRAAGVRAAERRCSPTSGPGSGPRWRRRSSRGATIST